jgi:large subunit ribosomal protein L21
MFAILKTGGKQYKVTSGDVVKVEKLAANQGQTVQFNEILMISGKETVIGSPLVEGAAVQAEVLDQIRGTKVINFVKRRRKHSSKRTKGHRQYLTLVKVTNIIEKDGDKSGVAAAVNGSGFMPTPRIEKAVTAKAAIKKPTSTSKSALETKKVSEVESAPKETKKPKIAKRSSSSEAKKSSVGKKAGDSKKTTDVKKTTKSSAKSKKVK